MDCLFKKKGVIHVLILKIFKYYFLFNVLFSTVWETVKQNRVMRQSHESSSELLLATINKVRMWRYKNGMRTN